MAHPHCSCIQLPTSDGTPLAGWRLGVNTTVGVRIDDGSERLGTCLGMHPDQEGTPCLVIVSPDSGVHGWYDLEDIVEVRLEHPTSLAELTETALHHLDDPSSIPIDGEIELVAVVGDHVEVAVTLRRTRIACAPAADPSTDPQSTPSDFEQGAEAAGRLELG